ncbi:MAG: GGDEF domain-containing protein, partial [Acidimicrobiales bacterium]
AAPTPALVVQRVPTWPASFDDARIVEALGNPEPVLARRLDPRSDLVLSRVLPGARNVVVLALQADAGRTGVVALEHGGHPTAQRLPRRTVVMLSQFTRHATLALRSAHLLAERQAMAMRDGLTGLANRRDFDQKLAGEVNRASRHGQPLSLVVIDLDHFKAVNDTHGHLAGDEVLRQVGQVLAGVTRDMDTAARYGGEEFALILPSCAPADACRVMDRIRTSLAAAPALLGVTVSAGVATLPSNANDSASLLAAADEALYRSKRSGRNRVTVSDRVVGPRLSSTGTAG